ncbi:MAG: PAS domain-containing protein, partial [Bacteroidota bacterium]
MVEDLPIGVIIHQDGKIVFTNPISLNLLKAKQPDQVIGKSVFEFVHPDYKQIVIDRIKGSLDNKTKQDIIEEVFLTVDGENIYVNAIAMPMHFNGKPAVMVVAI